MIITPCVCICLSVHVCICVFVYACMRVCASVCMYVFVCMFVLVSRSQTIMMHQALINYKHHTARDINKQLAHIWSGYARLCVCTYVCTSVRVCLYLHVYMSLTYIFTQGDLCHQLEQHVLCVEMRADAVFRNEQGTGV